MLHIKKQKEIVSIKFEAIWCALLNICCFINKQTKKRCLISKVKMYFFIYARKDYW